MKHFASSHFWECYEKLPLTIKNLADKSFEILKTDPSHPSLHLKKIGNYRSVRIGIHYRALAVEQPDGLLWIWIGNHADYDKMVKS
ncbi:MAG: hypothetical protein GYA70_10100 [Deltaproteobacteria bacterium]|nr:hypothetical protein [Deltaproteobacteria bacterium]